MSRSGTTLSRRPAGPPVPGTRPDYAHRLSQTGRLLSRDVRVRLDPVRHDHQEVFRRRRSETKDPIGLLVLTGGAQLVRVMPEEVVDVELPLVVDLLELDFRP